MSIDAKITALAIVFILACIFATLVNVKNDLDAILRALPAKTEPAIYWQSAPVDGQETIRM